MRKKFFISFLILILILNPPWIKAEYDSFFELTAINSSGQNIEFNEYEGKVILVVNISTQCGTTPQLKELENTYQKYKDHGFLVLAFPSEDFATMKNQSDLEIQQFCFEKYGVTFPIFAKATVLSNNIDPVFKYLTQHCHEDLRADITFNAEKFIVGRDGQVKARFGPFTGPGSSRIIEAIEREL